MGKKIDYSEFTVTCNGEISEQALLNYYNNLITFLIMRYGSEPVRIALEELIAEEPTINS
ncbi:hypothetical protein [uncultured Clostridium sp.]|uniref:hypothetical protein n=1 Tax=uncultured Clostridium sp. TaxID=59620 RepID=UPI00272F9CD1|nr:hypothetical protein [uncultured Clostridium sp.]